jgi:hypothetical protein
MAQDYLAVYRSLIGAAPRLHVVGADPASARTAGKSA